LRLPLSHILKFIGGSLTYKSMLTHLDFSFLWSEKHES
jgi:hypothetical protein